MTLAAITNKALSRLQKRNTDSREAFTRGTRTASGKYARSIKSVFDKSFARRDRLFAVQQSRELAQQELRDGFTQATSFVLGDKALDFLIQHSNIKAPTITSIFTGIELARRSEADRYEKAIDAQERSNARLTDSELKLEQFNSANDARQVAAQGALFTQNQLNGRANLASQNSADQLFTSQLLQGARTTANNNAQAARSSQQIAAQNARSSQQIAAQNARSSQQIAAQGRRATATATAATTLESSRQKNRLALDAQRSKGQLALETLRQKAPKGTQGTTATSALQNKFNFVRSQSTGGTVSTPARATTAPVKFNAANALRQQSAVQGLDSVIAREAQRNGLDPLLVRAVIGTESGALGIRADSGEAQGLMQIAPGTAKELAAELGLPSNFNVFDVDTNIAMGTRYLKQQLDRFGGDVSLAVAAYNAGPGAVQRYGNTVPPFEETQTHNTRVLGLYDDLLNQQNLPPLQQQPAQPVTQPAQPVTQPAQPVTQPTAPAPAAPAPVAPAPEEAAPEAQSSLLRFGQALADASQQQPDNPAVLQDQQRLALLDEFAQQPDVIAAVTQRVSEQLTLPEQGEPRTLDQLANLATEQDRVDDVGALVDAARLYDSWINGTYRIG